MVAEGGMIEYSNAHRSKSNNSIESSSDVCHSYHSIRSRKWVGGICREVGEGVGRLVVRTLLIRVLCLTTKGVIDLVQGVNTTATTIPLSTVKRPPR